MVNVKVIIAPVLSPLAVSLGVLVLGVFLLWCSRKQRTGKVLVLVSLILHTVISVEGISGRILRTLESQYTPINLSSYTSELSKGEVPSDIKWIVILGSGEAAVDQSVPYHWQIPQHARVRLMEAIRLHRTIPSSKLILTGGMGFGGCRNQPPLVEPLRKWVWRGVIWFWKWKPEIPRIILSTFEISSSPIPLFSSPVLFICRVP
jgi:hypothetical protein